MQIFLHVASIPQNPKTPKPQNPYRKVENQLKINHKLKNTHKLTKIT